ncbi:type IV secretory system conjugative DNA transfer family protein [Dinghuibacter silviterrae]|uniref:Type IV secretory pathway TraG/TraD family ATPase VirD4 n=1 Tax=Dinghuibacter silviterrae TaxID=1539049 RepID=A0A4R8DWL8_9BACT|nr:type IV secretory system conjugative DNA transfer family protein [Dinghuibacter silviterrae]TDX01817.1 type IV secretory pathway TraG/TraD family ATPase VirD4 [Dinghuibacter silviterrae]
MPQPESYRRLALAVAITAIALWIYIHAYALLGPHHWVSLDRWLYHRREDWIFKKIWALPSLAIAAWLMARLGHSVTPPVFNTEAESFPQQRRRLTNPYSVNLRTRYVFQGHKKRGWVNILEPFRGLLVMGSPGSGKSWYIIRPLIEQQLQKGFTMFVYDFKYDDLSRLVYRCWRQYGNGTTFHLVHFDDLARSQRCNPIHPDTLTDLAEAAEASRVLLLSLNRDWIRKQGDFFVESAINFLTALIWFLKRLKGGQYCTLPHAIELMQTPYESLFSILRTEPQIEFLINPFISAYHQNVMPQLEGQTAGAKISLARLAVPHLYYILSGNDFSLDINHPDKPRIVCMGNSPQKQEVYGAVLSLYVSRLVRQVNQPSRLPCALVFDEFPTLYFNGVDTLLATARSNKVAATLVVQDMSQLRKEYGKEQADVLLNLTGNVIAGQVTGESAHQLSERFGRILQERKSTHKGERSESTGLSYHLDPALPPSRLATLSAGEMVGVLSDNPSQPLTYKLFHGQMVRSPEAPSVEIPMLDKPPTEKDINDNYNKIKEEIRDLVIDAMERINKEPSLQHLRVQQKKGEITHWHLKEKPA